MTFLKLVVVDVAIFLTVIIVTTGGCLEAKIGKCHANHSVVAVEAK